MSRMEYAAQTARSAGEPIGGREVSVRGAAMINVNENHSHV